MVLPAPAGVTAQNGVTDKVWRPVLGQRRSCAWVVAVLAGVFVGQLQDSEGCFPQQKCCRRRGAKGRRGRGSSPGPELLRQGKHVRPTTLEKESQVPIYSQFSCPPSTSLAGRRHSVSTASNAATSSAEKRHPDTSTAVSDPARRSARAVARPPATPGRGGPRLSLPSQGCHSGR